MSAEPWTVADVKGKEVWPMDMAYPDISLPAQFGEGTVRSLVMRGGFQCCLLQGELTKAGTLRATDPSPPGDLVALGCAVMLEGAIGVGPEGIRYPETLRAGEFLVHHSAEPRMTLQLHESRLLFFNAGFSVGLLRELVSDLNLPAPLRQLVDRGQADAFTLPGCLDGRTRFLMEEIRCSPYTSGAARLHHQVKALELLAHLVDLWSDRKATSRQRWTQRDIARLQEARMLLLQNLEEPRSLSDLAALVGLSPTKLKLGFRDVFGSPMSEMLREARLQAAKDMLKSGDLPLKTIAHNVGFCDAASLSHSFKARFGFSPGQIRR